MKLEKNNAMVCFICKEKITANDNLSDIKRVNLPTGNIGYIHIKHNGVSDLKEV